MTRENQSNEVDGDRKQEKAQQVPESLKKLNEQGEQPRPENDVQPDPDSEADAGR
jgi:hypothetical protein